MLTCPLCMQSKYKWDKQGGKKVVTGRSYLW